MRVGSVRRPYWSSHIPSFLLDSIYGYLSKFGGLAPVFRGFENGVELGLELHR